MVEIAGELLRVELILRVSVLYREPMWLKSGLRCRPLTPTGVSVLYREPMWLKFVDCSVYD